ncbi:hypothetical protein Ais01nite_79770 [Asanoa ishikariensis]|uniref:hypothetical protein n=1 Tax=Asanoa ishikariensis TaxID=137265 RepID=UPI000B8610DA|nr:hypothetical protein [Asanoa ishikariensis]GIF69942.1 hypothetical protein Ais01nite_79770 [Asanoa ishikariensis]
MRIVVDGVGVCARRRTCSGTYAHAGTRRPPGNTRPDGFGLRFATANSDGSERPNPEIVDGSPAAITLIDVIDRRSIMDGGGARSSARLAAY